MIIFISTLDLIEMLLTGAVCGKYHPSIHCDIPGFINALSVHTDADTNMFITWWTAGSDDVTAAACPTQREQKAYKKNVYIKVQFW